MAKKIKFSLTAEKQRLSILKYYFELSGSKSIPSKIYQQLNRVLDIVEHFPYSGKEMGNSRRGIIKSHYKIIYKIEKDFIIILYIWDTRQSPKNFPL